MTPEPCSPSVHVLLLDALDGIVDVRETRMPGTVARLTDGRPRPTLWLNVESSVEARCRVLLDVLRALVLGPEYAEHARTVRRLRSVS